MTTAHKTQVTIAQKKNKHDANLSTVTSITSAEALL
jgi:hypothetical protein